MELSFAGKRVIITGASGFVGSHLARELARLKANVCALLDKEDAAYRLDLEKQITIRRLGGWDKSNLKIFFQTFRPHHIFHLRAAIGVIPGQERNFFFRVNTEETKELAKAALNPELESFINLGTIAEYGPISAPFQENSQPKPESDYGQSKLAATGWLKSFYDQSRFPAVLIRSSVVYGPGQKAHSYLIPNVILSCLKGEDFRLTGTGKQTRDPIFVSDVIRGLLIAATTPKARGSIINLGLGKEYSVIDIANLINKEFGNPITITTGIKLRNRGDDVNQWHDISKARQLLGWSPQVSLEEGIKITAAWYYESTQKESL